MSRVVARIIKLDDGTAWPDPRAAVDEAYAMRYNKIDDEYLKQNRMFIASVMDAYIGLSMRPEFERKPRMLRRAMKENP